MQTAGLQVAAPPFYVCLIMPAPPERLAALKAECLRRGVSPILQVDGGVNGVTAPLCVQAGADNLVAGSSLFRAADLSAAVCAMRG